MPRCCWFRGKGDNDRIFYYFLVENEIGLWTSPDPRKQMQFKWWKWKHFQGLGSKMYIDCVCSGFDFQSWKVWFNHWLLFLIFDLFFVKRYLLVGTSGMLWTVQWVSEWVSVCVRACVCAHEHGFMHVSGERDWGVSSTILLHHTPWIEAGALVESLHPECTNTYMYKYPSYKNNLQCPWKLLAWPKAWSCRTSGNYTQ